MHLPCINIPRNEIYRYGRIHAKDTSKLLEVCLKADKHKQRLEGETYNKMR